jgi:hypothetical protein
VSQQLSGDSYKRLAFINDASKRHWRLLIDDVSNPDMYSQIGIWWPGPYLEPSMALAPSYKEGPDELSVVTEADQGAGFVDLKDRPWRFDGRFRLLPAADKASFELMAATIRVGITFWFSLDAEHQPLRSYYGRLVSPLEYSAPEFVTGDDDISALERFNIPIAFREERG